jgi:NitT/TauT family transport system permease protein
MTMSQERATEKLEAQTGSGVHAEDPAGAAIRRGRVPTTRQILESRLFLVPLVFVIMLLAWEFAARNLVSTELLLPTPGSVWDSLWAALTGPKWGPESVYYHFWKTTKICLVGFAVGAAGGILLGMLMAQSRIVMTALGPYITAFQSLPRIAIAPIVVIWFGQGFKSNVIITATIVFLPVLVSTVSGLSTVDRGLLEMLRGFSATRWQTLRKVSLWSALPQIFAGLQVGIVFGVVGAIVAEWVGANEGLGVLLLQSQYNMDIPRSFAILVLLAFLGLVLNGLVVGVQRLVLFWQRDEDSTSKTRVTRP